MSSEVLVGAGAGGLMTWLLMQIKDSVRNIETYTHDLCLGIKGRGK